MIDKNTQEALVMEFLDKQKELCDLIDYPLMEKDIIHSITKHPMRSQQVLLCILNSTTKKIHLQEIHIEELKIKDIEKFETIFYQ